jgi:hypothetical protein
MPAAVRTIHLCEQVHAATENTHTQHDCNTCAICHFTFSAFTEAEFAACNNIHLPAECEPEAPFYNNPYSPALLSYGLRAPPFLN